MDFLSNRPEGGWSELANRDGLSQIADRNLSYSPYGIEDTLDAMITIQARQVVLMLAVMDLLAERDDGPRAVPDADDG